MLGQPNRILILLTLGREEACVCHIEAVLGLRQAAISQHLKALREAGLVVAHRDGRNIFYHLANPELSDAIRKIAGAAEINLGELDRLSSKPVSNCPCPRCNPGIYPALACKIIRPPA
jgi:DNA-binding transcriptional ArsR family regulator